MSKEYKLDVLNSVSHPFPLSESLKAEMQSFEDSLPPEEIERLNKIFQEAVEKELKKDA